MEVLGGLVGVAVVIGLIIYFVNKKKQEKAEAEENARRQKKREEERKQKWQEELMKELNKKKNEFETNGLPIIENETIKLTKNELCHFAGDAYICKLKKETVGYQGGSRGVSLRVMKGLSFRVGNYQGHAIKEDIIEKARGKIFLTNKKLVFSSINNPRVIKYSEIVNLNVVDRMIQIQTEERAYLFEVIDCVNFMVILEFAINNSEQMD